VVSRTQAAERGQVGLVRIAHTLSSVYATLPTIVARITEAHPGLEVQLREVFAGDVLALLLDGKFDLAICPRMAVPRDISRRELRREAFVAALSETHPLAARERLELAELAHERFEIWPRELAPGYHDAIVAACREAGFEPTLDEHASGGTVWGAIGQGKGVALVVRSLEEQVPRGIKLVDLVEPAPTLMFELLWHADFPAPAVGHVVVAASAAAKELGWLQ
jgi:DNA-binding transcriptional LysR family regulator